MWRAFHTAEAESDCDTFSARKPSVARCWLTSCTTWSAKAAFAGRKAAPGVQSPTTAAGEPTGTKTMRAAAHAASKAGRGRTTSATHRTSPPPGLHQQREAGFFSFLFRSCSRQLLSRSETRAEQVGAFDLAVLDRAKEVMLDQERLTILDAGQLVGDVEAVSDLMATRVDEL
jgi:hypothetical protein